jgi:predicted nicotinamide N-methyase
MVHGRVGLARASTTPDSVVHTPVPGGWSEREVTFAGRTFKLVLPAAPDEFLEELSTLPREQHDEHDVYWAQLWQAAPPTAVRILSTPWPQGIEALEFGCGLGIAGLAALAQGMRVTFSDYVEFAVQTALENAHRNQFTQAQGAVIDWRHPPDRQWPFVFGCDVLYNQAMHEPLVEFLLRVLTPDGLCWIGDAGRFHAAKFLHLAESRGFSTSIEDEQGRSLAEAHHGKFQLFVMRKK